MIYPPFILTLLLIGPAIAGIAATRSLSIRGHLKLLGLCFCYGALPLLITWGGLSLSDHFGCEAEAVIFHCPPPSWHENLLSGMFFAHWLGILTIPSAVLGAIGILFSLILKTKRAQISGNKLERPAAVFYRSRHKVVAGVCSAIAERSKLPIQGVRVVTVALAIIIPGLIWLLYLWFWLAFPLEPSKTIPREA
jgi:phage shock protein C